MGRAGQKVSSARCYHHKQRFVLHTLRLRLKPHTHTHTRTEQLCVLRQPYYSLFPSLPSPTSLKTHSAQSSNHLLLFPSLSLFLCRCSAAVAVAVAIAAAAIAVAIFVSAALAATGAAFYHASLVIGLHCERGTHEDFTVSCAG